MPDLPLAVDVSNYTGPIRLEQARCLRERGVRHLIAGTQVLSVTRAQLEAALAAGMSVDAYVYLYWQRDVRTSVREAVNGLQDLPVGRVWLDCEDDPAGAAPERVLRLIRDAVEACGAFACGIYTGRWWWVPVTGDSKEFADMPLWHAEYTPSPEVRPDFEAFRSYGGWQRPAIWQFQGTTNLCGLSVDLNLTELAPSQLGTSDQGAGSEWDEGKQSASAPFVLSRSKDERGEAATGGRMTSADSLELALLRAGQRFDRARALGRYLFRPAADPSSVELQRIHDGRGVSFEPPYLLPVD